MSEPPTVRRTVTVTLEHGLHMVPCSEIAKLVRDYPGSVWVRNDQFSADARSLLDLLQLKAEHGTQLVLEAGGDGAEAIVEGLARLFETNFGMNR
jgi:phosphotransferase system HPr (HPr) family protein